MLVIQDKAEEIIVDKSKKSIWRKCIMTESVTRYEASHLNLVNPSANKKEKRKVQAIGVAQLADALRLVERQLPIVLNSDIEKEEKEYILYLTDRALKMTAGDRRNEISL